MTAFLTLAYTVGINFFAVATDIEMVGRTGRTAAADPPLSVRRGVRRKGPRPSSRPTMERTDRRRASAADE